MRPSAVAAGVGLSLGVHAAAGLLFAFAGQEVAGPPAQASSPQSSYGYGLCGERRCAAPEERRPRAPIAQAEVEEPEVLEASLAPALGEKKPSKEELPELQTYEQPEAVEDSVNVDDEPEKPEQEPPQEEPEPKEEKTAEDENLEEILKDHREDDPRKEATELDEIVGREDGSVEGRGYDRRKGHAYGGKVRQAIREEFTVPAMLGRRELKKLSTTIRVTRMGSSGAIRSYRVVEESGNDAFDDAARAAIQQFVPSEGGSKRLPSPDSEVLRYINREGMVLELEGARMGR